jgi:hypothetical protein
MSDAIWNGLDTYCFTSVGSFKRIRVVAYATRCSSCITWNWHGSLNERSGPSTLVLGCVRPHSLLIQSGGPARDFEHGKAAEIFQGIIALSRIYTSEQACQCGIQSFRLEIL